MRLIDADALEKARDNLEEGDNECWTPVEFKDYLLNSQPTVDAEPVVHAHWIACGSASLMDEMYYCPKCRRHIYCSRKERVQKVYPYCNCGAKMDEEA